MNNDIKKRILIVTQYYYPETFKSTEIGEELVRRGHQVDVLAGIPNYPDGVYYKGYGLLKKRKEIVNGVRIYRCFQTPRGKKSSSIGLSLNFISFVISATLWVLFFFVWRKKYDAIITHEPSPITQIIPAIILGKIRNTEVYSWILDIWPDSMVSSIGEKRARFIKPILTSVTEWVYRNSKLILVSSKGMMELVNRNHDYSDKLVYFPNWCDDILSLPIEDGDKLPDGYKIMMAGNLNDGIGVEALVSLTDRLKDLQNLWFVFVGGGTREQYLRDAFKEKGINNVVMTGRLPFKKMPALYRQANAMLITLKETKLPHLRATVPLRIQSYMSAGKPILGMADGSSMSVINASGCGFCASAGDVENLASYIKDVVMSNREEFDAKGENARNFYEKYYQMNSCISNLEHYISTSDITNPPYPIPEV